MNEIASVVRIGAFDGAPQIDRLGLANLPMPSAASAPDFQSILSAGVEAIDQKVTTADGLVRQFAVDDSIPVHQVTIALEEARLSLELAMQVRTRLVEAYRELMNMQL